MVILMYNTKCRRMMVYITINTARSKMWMGFCYMVCSKLLCRPLILKMMIALWRKTGMRLECSITSQLLAVTKLKG